MKPIGSYDMVDEEEEKTGIEQWLNPDASEIDDVELSVMDHFNEVRKHSRDPKYILGSL